MADSSMYCTTVQYPQGLARTVRLSYEVLSSSGPHRTSNTRICTRYEDIHRTYHSTVLYCTFIDSVPRTTF